MANSITNIINKKESGLERFIALVQNSVPAVNTKQAYGRCLSSFLEWSKQNADGLNRESVMAYKSSMKQKGKSPATINQTLSAIKRLALELAYAGVITHEVNNGIAAIKSEKTLGKRRGNWLTLEEAQEMINAVDTSTAKGKRDRALLSIALGAGLRRSEIANLRYSDFQRRNNRWAIMDIVGKGGRVRSIPVTLGIVEAVKEWRAAHSELQAVEDNSYIFVSVNRWDKTPAENKPMTTKPINEVIKTYARAIGNNDLSAHDCRRTFAKLSVKGGTSMTQLQLSLGHASVQTTEIYVASEQHFDSSSPSDSLGLSF